MSNETRRRRAKHNRETRGKFGGGGGGNWVVQIPDLKSEDWFKVSSKVKNEVDIVEFRITQDWYPKLKCRGGGTCGDVGLAPGELDYLFEIPVHNNIGPNKSSHLCPMDAFGKPCPICEEKFALLEKNDNKWDRATMGLLNASWRDFYNVWNYATNRFEPWQAAYTSFEKLLQDAIDRLGEEIFPWAWDVGKTLEFLATEEPLGGGKGKTWDKPQIPTFHSRDPYPETVVDEMWGFDKYVKISSYDEIAADFYGMGDGVTSEEKQEVAGDYNEQPTTRTRSRGRTPATPEQAPAQTRSRGRAAPVEDDVPFKSSGKDKPSPCPFNHNWGHDVNNTLDCKNCKDEDFNGCIDENDRLKEHPVKEHPDFPAPDPKTTTSRRRTTATEPAPTSSRRRRA